MNTGMKKVFSIVMIILSAIGLILSVALIIGVWSFRQPVTQKLQSGVTKATTLLQTTDEGLSVIDQVIQNVYSSTIFLDDSSKALANTIQDSNSFIDNANSFVGQELINTITNTQTALDSAKASAAVIDNLLTTLSKVPLIGVNYSPSTPLNTAIGQVSDSLDPMVESLKNFQSNLKTAQSGIQSFSDQITVLEQDIARIKLNLAKAQTAIDKYHTQVQSMIDSLQNIHTSLPRWMTALCVILTLVILWVMVVQTSFLIQAISVLTQDQGYY